MIEQHRPQKSTLQQLLAQLSQEQLRFVAAMQLCVSKKEAAISIGIQPNTVYKWPSVVDEVLGLINEDHLQATRDLARQALFKAMVTKIDALDSDDDNTRQKAATELIEWNLGKALQPLGGPNNEPLFPTLTPEEKQQAMLAYAAQHAAITQYRGDQ